MFSRRTGHNLGTNRLTEALQQARQANRELVDLTLSNPTAAGLPYAEARLMTALSPAGSLVYRPDPLGMPSARARLAAEMREANVLVTPDRMLLTASTSEAYAMLLKLLCDPGDEVLVPCPSYPLFEHLCTMEGVTARPYPLRYDGQWHLQTSDLTASVGPKTRAVLIVNPNNPTGSYLKHNELEAIQSLGLPIISDEVFAAYPLVDDPRRVLSVLDEDHCLSFSLHGLSKSVGLPQLKLSWVCVAGTRADEAMARLELVTDTYLSVATPVQLAVDRLLDAGAMTRQAIRQRIKSNHASLGEAVLDSPLSLLAAEGGWYAILRAPGLLDEERWALELLERQGVVVHPGYFYDMPAGPHLVVSLLCPEATFGEGVKRLVAEVRARSGS